MFDLRYHVASLAAVFLMLVVGILIGVGISGRGFVDDAERDRLNGRIADLQEEVDAANADSEDLQRRQQAAQEFVEGAYPVLSEDRLAGKRYALIVVGPVDQRSLDFVQAAINDDAGGRVARMRAITMPLRLDAVESTLSSHQSCSGYVGDEQLGNLGRDLARELVTGGKTPLWDALVSRSSSSVRATSASRRTGSSSPLSGATGRPDVALPRRLVPGARQHGRPGVGVEPTRVEQSAIPVFQRYQLSTIDGIDTELGQLALILLLGGADPGDYGIRDTADDGILPPIEPLPAPSG